LTIQRKRVAKRLASGLLAGALALGGLAISGGSASAKTPAAESTKRIAGDDRYETAVEIARKYSNPGDNGLIIASGESPYDALAASALSGYKTSPILLVKSDSLPESVSDFLSDYQAQIQASLAQTIYVVGGTSAVSEAVVDAIKAIVHAGDVVSPITVTRLDGATRYETAKKISEVPGLMDKDDRLILVNGTDGKWADALSASTVAANKKWPIVLTDGTGLGTSGGAVVDAYQALAGSVDKYLIVGGSAVMSSDIEGELDALAVPMANIDRRGGADRWDTNYMMQWYGLTALMLGEGNTTTLAGAKVAAVSGVSPFDALVAGPWAATNGVHLVLTPPTAPTPYAAGLIALLSGAFDKPSEVWIIGGRNAVANSVRDAIVATAQSTNLDGPTLSGCEAGRTSIGATFPDALAWSEASKVTVSSSNAYWSLNAVKDSVTDSFITAGTQLGKKADNSTYTNTVFSMSTVTLSAGDVVKFHGFPEDTSGQNRTVGSTSCTVVADLSAPSATIKAVKNSSDKMDHFIVTLSENLAPTYTASLTALSNWSFTTSSGTAMNPFTANQQTLSATMLDSLGLVWKVSLSAGSVDEDLALGDVVTFAKTGLKDQGGNFALVDGAGTAAPDVTKPTMSISALTCNATSGSSAILDRGNLRVRAKYGAELGALGGSAANGYKLRVVSQRGMVIPTVVVDSAASLITVTMDISYHTADDVVTVAKNQRQTANFAFSKNGSTAITATLIDVSPTKGTNDCLMTVSYSEPASLTSPSLTVDGVVVGGISGNSTAKTSHKIAFTTNGLKGSSVTLTGTVTDAQQGSPQSQSTSANSAIS